MKPWEETWEVRTDATGKHRPGDVFLAGSPRAVLRPFGLGNVKDGSTAEERGRLAATAPEMARLLLRLEIIGDGAGYCPACHVLRPDEPHKSNCDWLTVLRKAGVIAS